MPTSTYPDPDRFCADAVSQDVRDRNRLLLDAMSGGPEWWMTGPAAYRDAQRTGHGWFPTPVFSPRARTIVVPSKSGPIPLRVIEPRQPARAVYLHLHGGGWVVGGADLQDPMLEALADACEVTVASVDYRLAPEHVYPAAPDDCETVALWLLEHATRTFGVSRLAIGGESAGAHLAAVTLLRLRDRLGHCPFDAAVLNYGSFDLNLTPSARQFGNERLVLRTIDMVRFRDAFLPGARDLSDPDVSPLYGDLRRLCPAVFTVGTHDALLDDSLFMHARWIAAGNVGRLEVYPGAAHGFLRFPDAVSRDARRRIHAFVTEAVA